MTPYDYVIGTGLLLASFACMFMAGRKMTWAEWLFLGAALIVWNAGLAKLEGRW